RYSDRWYSCAARSPPGGASHTSSTAAAVASPVQNTASRATGSRSRHGARSTAARDASDIPAAYARSMRGALAAGHPLTADAGADVLRAGGNAVDACIAAAAVSWICESPLTGPGGGGFLLVHHAENARTQLLDFFVSLPEREPSPSELIEIGRAS